MRTSASEEVRITNDERSPKLEARKEESDLRGSADGPVREGSDQKAGADKAVRSPITKSPYPIAVLVTVLALAVFGAWVGFNSKALTLRVPGADRPGETAASDANPVLAGR